MASIMILERRNPYLNSLGANLAFLRIDVGDHFDNMFQEACCELSHQLVSTNEMIRQQWHSRHDELIGFSSTEQIL